MRQSRNRKGSFLILLILGLVLTSCSSANEAVPTSTEFQGTDVPGNAQPSLESIPNAQPTIEATPSSVPSPTTEPTIESSPTALDSSGNASSIDGDTLLDARCTKCHGLDRVTNASKTMDEWRTTVERMISKGADVIEDEKEILIQYLAETYP